jgi:class 3 adenylate cyclase
MNEVLEERKLLAILFTDVVGYTALTERDEARAVRVRDRHRELVKTLVTQFEAEVVDTTGDESLSVFPSALGPWTARSRSRRRCATTRTCACASASTWATCCGAEAK